MRRLTLALVPLAALALLGGCRDDDEGPLIPGANLQRGATLIAEIGCGACHTVPGVRGAHGRIGPSLAHIATQSIIAGFLPNAPSNMITWVMAPQSVRPGSVMPDMELSEHDARDIVAYLYTLR